MNCLSVVTAKGRSNTAGCIKLAVFFFCLILFSGCNENTSVSAYMEVPFVKDGMLYSFSLKEGNPADYDIADSIKSYDFYNGSKVFTQRAVSISKKAGWLLAWNKKTQDLYHIDNNKKVYSKVMLDSYITFVDKNFILSQNNSFDEKKGFGFTLYSIKYTDKNQKIQLKKLWSGFIDCFVSDSFFTRDGVCISGGNREDTRNNVFYITSKGIHKCFSTPKKSDFLRIINSGENIYSFSSGRDKSPAQPVIYKFTLDSYIEGTDSNCRIDLKNDSLLPKEFECFFGYGFKQQDKIVIPASVEGFISFILFDYSSMKISSVVPEAGGCIAAFASVPDGVYYMARDPLVQDSYYGLSLFNGTECKKINRPY